MTSSYPKVGFRLNTSLGLMALASCGAVDLPSVLFRIRPGAVLGTLASCVSDGAQCATSSAGLVTTTHMALPVSRPLTTVVYAASLCLPCRRPPFCVFPQCAHRFKPSPTT